MCFLCVTDRFQMVNFCRFIFRILVFISERIIELALYSIKNGTDHTASCKLLFQHTSSSKFEICAVLFSLGFRADKK